MNTIRVYLRCSASISSITGTYASIRPRISWKVPYAERTALNHRADRNTVHNREDLPLAPSGYDSLGRAVQTISSLSSSNGVRSKSPYRSTTS